MKKQIGVRVTALLLAICMIGMAAVSAVNIVVSWTSLKREILAGIEQKTKGEAERINGWMDTQTSYVSAVAAELSRLDDYGHEALLPVLKAHADASEYYFDVLFGYGDGTIVFASGFRPDYNNGWRSTERPWYIGAISNPDKAFVTLPYIAVQTGRYCVTVSKAVVKDGQVVGVAGVDVHIEHPITVVNDADVGKGSYAFLTDSGGDVLLPPGMAYDLEDASRCLSRAPIATTGWDLYTSIEYRVIYEPLYRAIIIDASVCALLALAAAWLIYKIMTGLIAEVRVITAEKERLDTELGLAGNIQESVIPRTFPPFPDRPELDVFASIKPAKEVGGDFYDFFFIDDRRLVFVIADVSGKGVPAALFMMVARTLLHGAAMSGAPPDKIFARVNNLLREDNDSSMFVTAFIAVLDVQTGELTYCNAGHDPPVLLRDGDTERLEAKTAMALGAIRNIKYQSHTARLRHGDMAILYTDGVTEAFNSTGEIFSRERLLDAIRRKGGCRPEDMLAHIAAEVELFASGAEQSDDITMLAVRWL